MKKEHKLEKALALVTVFILLSTGVTFILITAPIPAKGDSPFSDNYEVSKDVVAETQSGADIAVNSTGGIHVVWEDDRGGDWNIYYANSSDHGVSWTVPNVRINTDGTIENQTSPSIAVDSSDNLYVAWQDKRDEDWDIYFANSTDGGVTWSTTNMIINTDSGTERQSNPDIAVDPSGVIYCVWEDRRYGDWDIFFAKSNDGGATWTHPNIRIINNDAFNASQRYPTVDVDDSGNIYVAWEDERDDPGISGDTDIYFTRSTDGGTNWDPNVIVNEDNNLDYQEKPTLAVNSTGIIYVAWHDYRYPLDTDIFFARSENGGVTWSTPNINVVKELIAYEQYYPVIEEKGGIIYMAWEDYRSGNPDVYFAQSSNGGLNWSDPNLRVNGDTSSAYQLSPAIAVSSNGTAYVAWEDDRFGDSDIFFAYLMPPPPPPTIDRIIISRSQIGATGWADSQSYFLSGSDVFYACGWNDTYNQCVDLVDVNWSCNDSLVGSVNPDFGPSTTFTPVGSGICNVTAENLSYGSKGINTTGDLTVVDLEIDRIIISLSDDCTDGWIGERTYPKNDFDTFYACGWNDTSNVSVMPVEVTWESDNTSVGTVTPSSGTSTMFEAVGVGTCTVNATNATYGINETGILTVNPLAIDDILISRSDIGIDGWIGDKTYKKHDTDTFYSCGWNSTHDEFVALINATWTSDNNSIGAVNFGPDSSTSFSAQGVGTCNVTAENVTHGINKTGVLTVDPLNIDKIVISNSSDNSTGWIGNQTYTKHDKETFYACGVNYTWKEFVSLAEVDWISTNDSVGKVTSPGSSTTFNASGAGICSVTASHATYGSNTTGILTVNPLDIDSIVISLSDNGSTAWIGNKNYELFDNDTFYACGWNESFNEFVELVNATWECNDTLVGEVTSPGKSTTFTVNDKGICRVNATNISYGTNDTGLLVVIPLEIDFIIISLTPDLSDDWIGDRNFVLDDSATFYACGWNDTYKLPVGSVKADWTSDDPDVGTVDPGPSNQTTFNAVGVGICNVSADNATYGLNWTGILSVFDYGIDYIIISNSSDASSGGIGDQSYIKYETDTFYACGWNHTSSVFVKLVEVEWEIEESSIGDVTPATGTSTTFTASGVGTCKVTATNDTYGSNESGILAVNPLKIDRIFISESPDGSTDWIGDRQYVGGGEDIFYACGWNYTRDEFVSLVYVNWGSDEESVGTVTSPGHWTNFSAQPILSDGTCKITATDPITTLTNITGTLSVIAPKIDYIQIRDEAGGQGNIITTRTYSVFQVGEFYAAAYNHTVKFLYNVTVVWECDNEAVGNVTSPGVKTNFTAQEVTSDNSCIVTATYEGTHSNSTGLLHVLSPRVDYIQIRDTAGGQGDIVTTITYNAGETDEFYSAAYNHTVKYLYDVSVTWICSDISSGQVTSPGSQTNFTAKNVLSDRTCTVTASYSPSIYNSTGLITVKAVVDTTPPTAPGQPTVSEKSKDKITISWPANIEPDLNRYIIQRGKSENGPWEDISTVDKALTSYTDRGLSPGKTYYYRVIAEDNASNPSPPSPFIKASTEPEEESPWFLIVIIIIIVIVVLAILFMLMRKKPKAEEKVPPEEPEPKKETSEEVPPPENETPSDTEGLEEELTEEDSSTIPEETQSPEIKEGDVYEGTEDEQGSSP